MRRALLLAIPLAALLGAPAISHAADDDAAKIEQAKTLFSAGAQAYSAGRYGAAIQAFQQAYALAPKAQILFSMAQAERKAWFVDKRTEDLKNAIAHYHAYLDQVPSGGRRADAADGLAELEPIASKLTPQEVATPAAAAQQEAKTRMMVTSSTPGARASLDGGPATEVPLIDDVAPGKHHVRVSADGFFDEDRDALAASGSLAAIDVPLRERPALLAVTLDATASVSVDGRAIATTPLARPIELAAGTHFVSIVRNGRKAFGREVTLERGKQATLVPALETSGQRTAAWIVLGAGGAAAIAGGVFTAIALVDQANAQGVIDAQGRGNILATDIGNYAAWRDARGRWRTAAIGSFGAAAGLLVVGGTMFLFDRPSVETPASPIEPQPKPGAPPKSGPSLELGIAPWGAVVGGRF